MAMSYIHILETKNQREDLGHFLDAANPMENRQWSGMVRRSH